MEQLDTDHLEPGGHPAGRRGRHRRLASSSDGAYLYLTASGAPHQMERGKSAMMTALAGIVLALIAYGVVELVMNAVVDPGIEIDDVLPEPQAPDAATPTPDGG